MGPVVVVFEAELIEAALLCAQGRLGRARGLAFEGPMHPLVPAVLFGSTRLNQLRPNAEPDPPDGEGGQAAEGIRRERGPVIGADPLGQPVVVEEALEYGAGQLDRRMQETLAAEEKARGPVLDRQGIAINPIAGFELPLVVDGPNVVGCGHRARRPAGMRAPSPSRRPRNQAFAFENRMGGRGMRQLPVWLLALQLDQELLGAPVWPPAAQ